MDMSTDEVGVPTTVVQDDEPVYEEAPAEPQYDSIQQATAGRPALVRSSTKNKTRRKSTIKKLSSRRRSGSKGNAASSARPFSTAPDVMGTLNKIRNGWENKDSDSVVRCLLELERMVETNEDNAEKLANADAGIELIVSIAKETPANDNMKATGCWVLSNLARAEGCAELLFSRNVADFVLDLMKDTANGEQVQHACLALLCNIALHEKLRKALSMKGAIPTISAALSNFPNHEWIQYTSLQTLQNFANTNELCGSLLDHDTVPRILHAMHHFDDHDELLQSSNWIFSCLAFNGDDACRSILQRQHRIAKGIVQTMKDSPDHLGVQFTGCSALSNIARNGDLLDSLVDDGMVTVVTACLRKHDGHEGIQMTACRCYVVLASNKRARQLVKSLQGLPLCERVLDRLPNTSAAIEAQEALRLHLAGQGSGCCTVL